MNVPFWQQFYCTPAAVQGTDGAPSVVSLPQIPPSAGAIMPQQPVPVAVGFILHNVRQQTVINSADTLTCSIALTFYDGSSLAPQQVFFNTAAQSGYLAGTQVDGNTNFVLYNSAGMSYPTSANNLQTIYNNSKLITSVSFTVRSSINNSTSIWRGIVYGIYEG